MHLSVHCKPDVFNCRDNFYSIRNTLIFLCISMLITACGGGGSSSNVQNNIATLQDTTVHGSVGDGPISGAHITVYDSNGEIVAESTSDQQAGYNDG